MQPSVINIDGPVGWLLLIFLLSLVFGKAFFKAYKGTKNDKGLWKALKFIILFLGTVILIGVIRSLIN